MRQVPQSADGCNEFERVLLGDLELTQKYMQRVMGKSQDPRLTSRAFHAQGHLLTAVPSVITRENAAPFLDSSVDPAFWTAVIPAAGRGSRLGFEQPKILFPIAGATILEWPIG